MMRFSAFLFSIVSGILLAESIVQASFHRDVVSKVANNDQGKLPFISNKSFDMKRMENELLSKAIPVSEYNDQLKSVGIDLLSAGVSQGEHDGARRLEDADDYYVNEQYMYSFSGYSMKYARCQPIQQFSEDALAAGEYSPMVTQDVVILRLCPQKSCSSSRQYGCHYNYAEYAIGLYDYIRIMLRFKADKQDRLCNWCAKCLGEDGGEGRRLEEQEGGEEGEQDNEEEEEEENAENENNEADDNYGGNNYNANYDENDECYIYGSYCDDYYYSCGEVDEEQQQQDDYYNQQEDEYLDEEDFFEYLGCTELADNYGGIYFVRPTCDAKEEKITMSVYYDEYCSQSAASSVSMSNLQVQFNDTVFTNLYDGSCIDCSESYYPPNFNANSYMCNKIHSVGADCTQNMVYDLFDGQQSDATECSFIESIRFGTYDANGEIAVEATDDAEEVVTDLQKVGLVISAFICTAFVVYACFLHHSMTNLLIKSLSHRELLPPSRHNKRRSPSKSRRKRSLSKGSRSSSRRGSDDDDEWDRSKPLRSPV